MKSFYVNKLIENYVRLITKEKHCITKSFNNMIFFINIIEAINNYVYAWVAPLPCSNCTNDSREFPWHIIQYLISNRGPQREFAWECCSQMQKTLISQQKNINNGAI